MNQSDVTIIIPHLGGTPESEYALDQCLLSLQETTPDIKKIVAVNGNFKCNATHIGMGSYPNENIELLAMTAQGQCKAVNAAVATTNTPWVMISNDDMIYPPGWFEKLTNDIKPRYLVQKTINPQDFEPKPGGMIITDDVNGVKKLDDILCISPMLIEPRAGAPTFREYFCGGAGGDFDKAKWEAFAADWATPENIRTGFNFPVLIHRELWDTIGGYDINYDPWGSNGDSDLEYKIRLAGVQPYQNINCIVYHFSQTSGTFEPRNDSHRFKNYAYFKEKWGFDRTDNGIWEATFTIPDEGRIFRPEWENKYFKNM